MEIFVPSGIDGWFGGLRAILTVHAEGFGFKQGNFGGRIVRLAAVPGHVVGDVRQDGQLGRDGLVHGFEHGVDLENGKGFWRLGK